MQLNQALKILRLWEQIPQFELAKKLSLSKSYISEVESGLKKNVSLEVLQKYSEFFDIPVSSIIYLAENLDNPPETSTIHPLISGILEVQYIRKNKNSV